MVSYNLSKGMLNFSAQCLKMEWTAFDLLYLSSHFTISSAETTFGQINVSLFFVNSQYYGHFVLTDTDQFWIERIRLLDNSDNNTIPSILSYSNNFTYAPISAIS